MNERLSRKLRTMRYARGKTFAMPPPPPPPSQPQHATTPIPKVRFTDEDDAADDDAPSSACGSVSQDRRDNGGGWSWKTRLAFIFVIAFIAFLIGFNVRRSMHPEDVDEKFAVRWGGAAAVSAIVFLGLYYLRQRFSA